MAKYTPVDESYDPCEDTQVILLSDLEEATKSAVKAAVQAHDAAAEARKAATKAQVSKTVLRKSIPYVPIAKLTKRPVTSRWPTALLKPFMLQRLPGTWDLLGIIFTKKVRVEIWLPVIEEDKRDLAQLLKLHRGKTKRAWINCCLLLRTALRILQTLHAVGGDRALRIASRCFPEWVRQLWRAR